MNVVRAVSSEGYGRINHYTEVHWRLKDDPVFRRFFEQGTTVLPRFYVDQVQKDLGPMWKWLPQEALHHEPNAYLKSEIETSVETQEARLVV